MRTQCNSIIWAFLLTALLLEQARALTITNITFVGAKPTLAIHSDTGVSNAIQYVSSLDQTNWATLTNLMVSQSPYSFEDSTTPAAPQRFYRVIAAAPVYAPAPAGMSLIPAGTFNMGDISGDTLSWGWGELSEELPIHQVFVSAYYMEQTLVPAEKWEEVYHWATNHGYVFPECRAYYDDGLTNRPALEVCFFYMTKWCNARSEMEGLVPCYYTDDAHSTVYREGQIALSNACVNWSANGWRLPTEAEWEKAARGGLPACRFPWGDYCTHSNANYCAGEPGSRPFYDVSETYYTHPVFKDYWPPTNPVDYFPTNGYGLHDMAGNVYQVCWDVYGAHYYDNSPGVDPRGVEFAELYSNRGVRGGTWMQEAGRCSGRFAGGPEGGGINVGFRCVRTSVVP